MSINTILRGKGPGVITVAPTDTVAAVCQVLTARRVGAVLVVDEREKLLGVVSERDVVGGVACRGAGILLMNVSQIMTEVVYTVTPDTPVMDAMETMTIGRVRHLPVIDGGHLIGIVSIGDVVKETLENQAHEVRSLRDYVAGQG